MPKKKKNTKKPRFKTSFPLQRDEKGKVTPVEGVKGGFADTLKEKGKWEKAEKDYKSKQAARDREFRAGVKRFFKKVLSGATTTKMKARLKDLEKSMYPNRFPRKK
jgi:hypothetical protein